MEKPALKIGFAGTPDFAASHLQALLDADQNIAVVYTQPDRPAGRGKQDQASPVKKLARQYDLPIRQPASLKNEDVQLDMAGLQLDVLIVVAYGLLLPPEILGIPKHGCINVHASLLPRWRGAAPIEHAILAGDKQSGVTIMQMDAGLDTGDILLSLSTSITDEDNAATLTAKLIELGQQGLLKVLQQIQRGTLDPVKQNDSLSTYAGKLGKQDSVIDWDRPAREILLQINALYPRAPASFLYRDQRIRVIQAELSNEKTSQNPGTILQLDRDAIKVSCADSVLLLRTIQLPGKSAMDIGSFLNGRPDFFVVGDSVKNDAPS
ncbi:MAG: methionyl-tRNA formyltransferase [Gammaproteobacteria bacterium]|nr:methionyl-tRNA formyltransferase [Gammaproteobacteria bacterium]|tara:strand:- start:261374 stop:262339 length:966 start_codon:yes stop_codon:yes gene_type:complete